jgi:hypothetical protein
MAMVVAIKEEKVVANLMGSPIRALIVEVVVAKSVADMIMIKTVLTGRSVLQTAMAEVTVGDCSAGKYMEVLVNTLCMPPALLRISHFPIELRF